MLQASLSPVAKGALIGGLVGACIAIIALSIMIPIMKMMAKKLPRFSQIVPIEGNTEDALSKAMEILNKNGYKKSLFKGEEVYKKGKGLLLLKQYIKVEPADGGVLVQGFVSIYGTATGLSGVMAVIPKSLCHDVVVTIIKAISNEESKDSTVSKADDTKQSQLNSITSINEE